MSHLTREARILVRKLLKSPTFTLLSILTLAVGIGANSAIFSIVDAVLLRPLPYPESDRLVALWHSAPKINPKFEQSDGTYLLYRRDGHVFEDVGIYAWTRATLTGDGPPERVAASLVSPSLFPLLGVSPGRGRGFVEEEELPGAEPTVVLSHDLWTRRFGASEGAVGRRIQVDGVTRTVVGVMPEGFRFPSPETELYLPVVIDRDALRVTSFRFQGVARLRDGVTLDDATAELAALIARLPEEYPDSGITPGMLANVGMAPRIHSLRDDVVGDVGRILWTLLGTVGLVLLIACANVANLFLVRAEGRRRELALRTALGATRVSLGRAFLAEGAVLALAAGVAGLGLAAGAVRLLRTFGPEEVPRLHEVGIDATVVAFTFAIALLTSLLFAALPALRRIPHPATALRDGGRGSTAGRARLNARSLLVVSQIALALVLLVGSGLMLRSFQGLRNVDPGFDDEGVLTLQLSLPEARYGEARQAASFFDEALERLRTLPGVAYAGAVHILPLTGRGDNTAHVFEDFPPEPDTVPPVLITRFVSSGYFETLRIPLREGRVFERADDEQMRPVAVVSEALAERYWPGKSALGKRLHVGMPEPGREPLWHTIVGVVGSVREEGLEEAPAETVYYPLRTASGPERSEYTPRSLSFAVRSGLPPTALAQAVRSAVWELDGQLPVSNVRGLEQVVADASARTAFTTLLLLIAAVVALVLGVVGLYGVISFVVSRRTQEIGVRMALGADRAAVSRMVLRQGLATALVGVGLGLAAAFALTRLLAASLYGVSPTDPTTFVAVPLVLLAAALLACHLPAQRAASVDPLVALRCE